MKPLVPLLAVSLVANAALVVVFSRHESNPVPARAPTRDNGKGSAVEKSVSAPAAATPTAEIQITDPAKLLALRDPAALSAQLRSMGFSEDAVRAMVRALLRQPYLDRYRALIAKHKSDKSDLQRGNTVSSGFTPEERTELRDLQRDINRQVTAVLGPSANQTELSALRYGYLSPEKAEQVALLSQDYREMQNDLRQEMARFPVASDDQRLALLEQEQLKDLGSLLTPSELAEYDLRNSKTAASLRYRLGNVSVSDDEFHALFDTLRQAETAQANLGDVSLASSDQQAAAARARRDLREQTDEIIRAQLGEDRYAAYRRSMDPDYHSLLSASARFNLPTQTIDQVYGLHATVSAESIRIANDASLDPAHKVLALAGLAQQTRSQVKTALGNEIGTAYLNTSMQWLNRMASGYAVSFPATGYINTFTPVVPRTKAPSVAPAAPVTPPAK